MDSDYNLQKRHIEVTELHRRGYDRRAIAAILGVSTSTVYWHIKREQARQAGTFSALRDEPVIRIVSVAQ